ncbi:MAG TPA: cystathionine gamma-synthase [Chitinophagales bacterium]|nr:cystathionine gamma-synthase [Chitinophagales bacterium]HRK25946.1 cystathionine gamma-synthase [Chitinophagales bacterium]
MKFATKVIHAGIKPDAGTGAIMTPIFQTSTYVQEAPGVHKGYEYGRTQNPTRTALQQNLAALENARYGVCFASGLAATDSVMRRLQPGDEVIACNDLYGGTYRLFVRVFQKYGIKFHFVDMHQPQNVLPLVNERTKMMWVETPTNPMLGVVDIAAISEICKTNGILLCVDNTFASPYLQNPIDWGADVVVHSVTKYLGGHSDVIMGAVMCNDEAFYQHLTFHQNAVGAVPAPMDCFLVLRGVKTLHLRMEAHCKNAAQVAAFLATHKAVAKVNYPGFETHPNHAVAKRQMRGFGGMVSFSLKQDTMEAAVKVLSNTHLFSLAESLGGVESLIGHPATMTHASIPFEERQKTGVLDSLLRLSVGIEDPTDLIADLEQALNRVL